MIIYIVTWHAPGDATGIEAVFSSKEKAKKFVKEQKKINKYGWLKIKEITVDQKDKVYLSKQHTCQCGDPTLPGVHWEQEDGICCPGFECVCVDCKTWTKR